MSEQPYILAIESSCDETSAAVLIGTRVLSNCISSQIQHAQFGGVVPEVASRAHQAEIYRVVHQALVDAQVNLHQLHAVAVTQGPGLVGSLLVGLTYAKSLSMALNIPLISVNHMQAHIMAHFEDKDSTLPQFPFLNLTVSGGHTQLVLVQSPLQMEVIGETIDDAAGEAFDKAAKVLGLEYPGGPQVDKFAKEGDAKKYKFAEPKVKELDFSFSGLKTSLLYFLRDELKKDESFIQLEIHHVCASYQHAIVSYLLKKVNMAIAKTDVRDVTLSGGVSANSELRKQFLAWGESQGIRVFIPPMALCTDNAAMIGLAAYYKYLEGDFASLDIIPLGRMPLN